MELNDRIEILRKTSIFSETDMNSLRQLAEALVEEEYKSGRIIFRKGDKGDALFVIVAGTVKVHDGTHILARLKKGQVFGEYALIDEETRSASITADEKTKLLKLSKLNFYSLTSKNNEVTKGILKVLIKRVREMNELEEKLSKSYLKISKQKQEIESQHNSIKDQKKLLEQQNFDLLSLNEEKNEIIRSIVHGLRNPLTSSMCMLDMIKSNPASFASGTESLDILDNSLNRIKKLINQVLDIHTIESKHMKIKYEKLNLARIIRELLVSIEPILEQKKISIRLDLKSIEARMNEVYFSQIIDNLLSNAIRFSPPESEIHIRLLEKGNKARIEIIDQGPGIPSEELENIFYNYHRQTADQYGNQDLSGLGLRIVKKYTDVMKGQVWCESDEGKGSTFVLEFNKIIEIPEY